jgi:hypothetical protein
MTLSCVAFPRVLVTCFHRVLVDASCMMYRVMNDCPTPLEAASCVHEMRAIDGSGEKWAALSVDSRLVCLARNTLRSSVNIER